MSSVPPHDPDANPPRTPGRGFAPGPDSEAWARGLVSSLFDIHFETFLTRRIAWLVYVLGLISIALSALVRFVSALASLFVPTSPAAVIWAFLTAFVAVPIGTALAVLVLRVLVEVAIAIVGRAEGAGHTGAAGTGAASGAAGYTAAPGTGTGTGTGDTPPGTER